MARRLSFEGYDGSHPIAIQGIPAPLRGDGRAHSLVKALEIALSHEGLALGYDVLMGLCGLAFRTPPWPHPPAPTAADVDEAVATLADALSGCMALHRYTEAPTEDDVLDTVARAIDVEHLCVALGWGSEKDRWSVITGYDRGKTRLLGHCALDAPRERYEAWPPILRVLVAITDRPRPRGPEAVEEALRRGAQRWEEDGARLYAAWIEELRLLEEPPGAEHEVAVELLADARAAAAGFAEGVAGFEPEVPAAWLTSAAEHWRELVLLLEARGVPHSPEALDAVETPEGREDWANLLAIAAQHEEAAAAAVRQAHSVDYPPEEAAQW